MKNIYTYIVPQERSQQTDDKVPSKHSSVPHKIPLVLKSLTSRTILGETANQSNHNNNACLRASAEPETVPGQRKQRPKCVRPSPGRPESGDGGLWGGRLAALDHILSVSLSLLFHFPGLPSQRSRGLLAPGLSSSSIMCRGHWSF